MSELVGAAAALGFFGSAHCVVMCGPLAIAACARSTATRGRAFGAYLAGRGVSYAFAGALAGHAGAALTRQLPLAALQSVLLAAVALSALVRGARLLARAFRAGGAGLPAPVGAARPSAEPARTGGVLHQVAHLLPRRGVGLGLATGALPCGLLAGAWALAAASGSALTGALVMVTFCAATTPALIATVLAASRARALAASPTIAGFAWCALGLWLGARPVLSHLHSCH